MSTAGPDPVASAKAIVQQTLDTWDLGSLAGWAYNEILNGVPIEQVYADLTQQQAYKDRFAGMAGLAKLGLPAMSPAEYLAYETQAEQLMRAANLPTAFWNRANLAKLIGSGVGLPELNDRIAKGFEAAVNTPPEVQQAFGTYFGARGVHALASMFLDPDVAAPELERMVQAATIGGSAIRAGVGLGADTALSAARLGVSGPQADAAFSRLRELDPIMGGSLAGPGVSQQTGIDALLLGDSDASRAVKAAVDAQAAQTEGSGGYLTDAKGLVGLGNARNEG